VTLHESVCFIHSPDFHSLLLRCCAVHPAAAVGSLVCVVANLKPANPQTHIPPSLSPSPLVCPVLCCCLCTGLAHFIQPQQLTGSLVCVVANVQLAIPPTNQSSVTVVVLYHVDRSCAVLAAAAACRCPGVCGGQWPTSHNLPNICQPY
jgi:hypothetical protein